MLFAFELPQVVAIEHENSIDAAQGKRIRFAADLDQQGSNDRHGDRQLEDEPRAPADTAGHAHRAAHRVHHALNDVEPDTAAGDLGDIFLGRESGQKQEVEQLGLAQSSRDPGRGQATLDDLGAEPVEIDAPAVIGQDDLEHARAMARLQVNDASRRLARRLALVGRFQPMVERIANQMVERRLEPIENVAVDARRLTDDFKLRLLAQLTRQIAHQPWESLDAIGRSAASGWPVPRDAAGSKYPRSIARIPRSPRRSRRAAASPGPLAPWI